MPWIKKNLALVLGGLIGLILLGGSGLFLYSESTREGEINLLLEEKRAEWTRLNGLAPYPDDKNIQAVKEESKRIEKVAADLRTRLVPVEVPEVRDTYSLKLLIETTISDLNDEAAEAGVRVPDRFAYTFQRLREMPQFQSNGIPQLAEQVGQITAICRVLFGARIHSLDTLRRSPVLKEEGGGSDYLTKKSITNRFGIIRTPYDFSFKSFSGELADVLAGFAALDQCVVIKTLNVEPTSLPPSGGPMSTAIPMMAPVPGMAPGMPGGAPPGMDPALAQRYGLGGGGRPGEGGGGAGMDAAMRSRYGLGPGGGDAGMRSRYGGLGGGPGAGMDPSLRSRYGLGPAVPTPEAPVPGMVPAAPRSSSGPSVLLDEKPLRVIMQIDFVRPKPAEAAGGPGPVRRTVVPDAEETTPVDASETESDQGQ